MKKLIPALALLLISAAVLSTASYAWFSMNRTDVVTGMEIQATVSDNLLIASATGKEMATAPVAESLFKSSLTQTRTGQLEPVSTINGVDFFYNRTTNARADGSRDETTVDYVAYDETSASATPLDNANANKKKADDAFNRNYGISGTLTNTNVCYGYIDYDFELKAINSGKDGFIKLDTLDLVTRNANAAAALNKAFRLAIFVQGVDPANYNADGTVNAYNAFPATATAIYTLAGAEEFTNGKAVNAVDSVDTVAAKGTKLALPVTENSITYYKLTMRLYIEGEDTTCNNATFMKLTDNWSLEFSFTLDTKAAENVTTNNSVENISRYTTATVTANGEATAFYYDGTNFYKKNEKGQILTNDPETNASLALNVSTQFKADALTAAELDAVNTAFKVTFTRAAS